MDVSKNVLDIYGFNYSNVPLSKLKEWVEKQIADGHNAVTLNISWGYYNDIDSLELEAKTVKKKDLD